MSCRPFGCLPRITIANHAMNEPTYQTIRIA
ncbi:MAG: hypothetical protein QOC54_366 [Baekduia sp.]|nr:hypothetical protein [Baekduia sp.]